MFKWYRPWCTNWSSRIRIRAWLSVLWNRQLIRQTPTLGLVWWEAILVKWSNESRPCQFLSWRSGANLRTERRWDQVYYQSSWDGIFIRSNFACKNGYNCVNHFSRPFKVSPRRAGAHILFLYSSYTLTVFVACARGDHLSAIYPPAGPSYGSPPFLPLNAEAISLWSFCGMRWMVMAGYKQQLRLSEGCQVGR